MTIFTPRASSPGLICLIAICLLGYTSSASEPLFLERADAVGVRFHHHNGMTGKCYYPEINGPGGALFDSDNDGDLDLYLVQGGCLGPHTSGAKQDKQFADRLFRNDLQHGPDGRTTLHFTDVTPASGIQAHGYGFGVSAADYNHDGHVDLYLTNYGPNQLWRNEGNGRFTDVTNRSATAGNQWSTSATFLDYDRDGLLDLYVANYLQYNWSNHKTCITTAGIQDYCGPNAYADARDRLYRNRGNGTFQDETLKSGVQLDFGAGMGVVCADFNRDTWPDLYVANDADANLLWINQRNGTFVNQALLSGCAVNEFGVSEAGMGVAAADFDGDSYPDLLVTHLSGETHTLYHNDGTGNFEDQTLKRGFGSTSLNATGWGVAFFDYDNDGWLDALVANGAVEAIGSLVQKKDPFPYHQPNQLFRNRAGLHFEDVTAKAGPAFARSEVSRGAAIGDIDNDGDSDIVIFNNNGKTRILINATATHNNWLGIRLVQGKQDALGTIVCAELSDQRRLWRRVAVDGSYLSSSDPRLLFGLGRAGKVVRLLVLWPDGTREEWLEPALNRYHLLKKGMAK